MNKLDELIIKYPEAFESEFYFECGDGWHDIIEPIIIEINNYNKHKSTDDRIYPIQVKEKFGTLRFYTGFCHDEIDKLVDIAEDKSAHTCMTCGKPGELISARWLYTACPEHIKPGNRPYSEFIKERDSKECV